VIPAPPAARYAPAMITQQTTFPATPTMPGGNQIIVTGSTGTELKAALLAQLAARQAAQTAGSAVLDAAVAAISG